MNVEELYSRVKEHFPNVSLRAVIAHVNDALVDQSDDVGERKTETIDMVSGTEWYDLASGVIEIKDVYYLNGEGKYRKIKRLIGDTIETRLT